jgi:hypothetical protein
MHTHAFNIVHVHVYIHCCIHVYIHVCTYLFVFYWRTMTLDIVLIAWLQLSASTLFVLLEMWYEHLMGSTLAHLCRWNLGLYTYMYMS